MSMSCFSVNNTREINAGIGIVVIIHHPMRLFLVAFSFSPYYTIRVRRCVFWVKKEKLIAKLKSNPKTFTFDDAETLLGYFNYHRSN